MREKLGYSHQLILFLNNWLINSVQHNCLHHSSSCRLAGWCHRKLHCHLLPQWCRHAGQCTRSLHCCRDTLLPSGREDTPHAPLPHSQSHQSAFKEAVSRATGSASGETKRMQVSGLSRKIEIEIIIILIIVNRVSRCCSMQTLKKKKKLNRTTKMNFIGGKTEPRRSPVYNVQIFSVF